MSQIQERWKKGIFHRGEFKQYLKVMSQEEMEYLLCLKENEDIPKLVQTVVIVSSLGEMLEKNKKKTLKIPRLVKKYSASRNAKIRSKLIEIFSLKRKSEHKQPVINDNHIVLKNEEIEQIKSTIAELVEKAEKDVKFKKSMNKLLDDAKDDAQVL